MKHLDTNVYLVFLDSASLRMLFLYCAVHMSKQIALYDSCVFYVGFLWVIGS